MPLFPFFACLAYDDIHSIHLGKQIRPITDLFLDEGEGLHDVSQQKQCATLPATGQMERGAVLVGIQRIGDA